jgi:hypothetical protein
VASKKALRIAASLNLGVRAASHAVAFGPAGTHGFWPTGAAGSR